ncbi:hypothetical protein CM49_03658 [Paenibacillus sp. P1XP2]|nr:hypothetical protein CM49_03658 [Paenibacillus sp. P1XP2]
MAFYILALVVLLVDQGSKWWCAPICLSGNSGMSLFRTFILNIIKIAGPPSVRSKGTANGLRTWRSWWWEPYLLPH